MYDQGWHVRKDEQKALELYIKAHEKGIKEATEVLELAGYFTSSKSGKSSVRR